jgi:tricorn protease
MAAIAAAGDRPDVLTRPGTLFFPARDPAETAAGRGAVSHREADGRTDGGGGEFERRSRPSRPAGARPELPGLSDVLPFRRSVRLTAAGTEDPATSAAPQRIREGARSRARRAVLRHLLSSLGRIPMRTLTCSLIGLVCLLVATAAWAGMDARMLRYPDVSDSQIAFVYAGDIWLVPKEGGTASRLSTPKGEERFPRFSPDGTEIAFTGNYDGNLDLYVIPVTGGVPRRLTHNPAPDRLLDWYPAGRSILYASPMASGTNRFNQLYEISSQGGLPEKLPVPYGESGSISPDGRTLAYTIISRDFRTWKRYRGGMAPDIWLFDLHRNSSRLLTDDMANDARPMWHSSRVYFLSDRDESMRANLWVTDTKTGETRQLTFFEELDVAFPGMGPSEVVFSCGSDLYLLDLETEEQRKIDVEVVTDRSTLKPATKMVAKNLASGGISPTGKRAVLEARGEVFTIPAEHGFTRNLTRTSGFAERYPAWSPDGKWIAYFSDRTGEYELTIRPADGSGEERTLTSMGPGFRYHIYWSPDSEKLAFVDQAMNIYLYDLEAEKLTRMDRGVYMFQGDLSSFRVAWSADSRWAAFSREIEDARRQAVFLYDTQEATLHQATSAFYSDSDPFFDPDGKYLYFLSTRTFAPIYSDLDNSWIYANTTNVVAVPLRKDVPSPLAPRNDDEEVGDDNGDEESGDDENGDRKKADKDEDGDDENGDDENGDKKDEPEPVEIDLEEIERRLVVLPAKNGNYDDLYAVSGKVLYRRQPRTGSGSEESPIVFYDLEEREEKTILPDADGYDLSADGKKLIVLQEEKLAIIDIAEDQKMEKPLDLTGMETTIDPAAEWRQIFNDVWRLERDYFYDPDLHGVDWDAMRERYGALLADAVTRWDLHFIIGELIAELNASHAYRFGGDTEQAEERAVGLLGADFAFENGAYRIEKILDGGPWDSEVRSPLKQPGVDINEGDYLLAVNGVPVDTGKDPWAAFQGLAGKTVLLTVNDRPGTEEAREVLVETLSSEGRLRNLAWIEENRRKVDEATGGRVGYVYVPDTSIGGQTELVRMFRGQFHKDGLIIDERFNSGGQIPDRFVELLNRPLYNYWAVRDGKDWQWPFTAHKGPQVMLVNGWSGSGGDLFPYYFREAGLGPLIGTRTWGGLIGVSGCPQPVDGGFVTVPTFGIYSTDGNWIVEGHGVEPDIEVPEDPAEYVDGGDPQLDRAIEEVMARIRRNPPTDPPKPTYPDRSGR